MVIERPQPIVQQVNQILRQRIREGIYLPGTRMPSESDLATELGVSRTTLRMAMVSLVEEGVIIRKQGDGTYISKRALELNAHSKNFWSFTRLIGDGGHLPEVQKLAAVQRPANEQEAALLEVPTGAPLYVLERLFFADSRPVIFSINLLPFALLCHDPSDYDPQLSIYDFLRMYADQEIAYSTSDIVAMLPPVLVGRAMSLPPDQPLLRFVDLFYNKNGQPVVYGINYYDEKFLGLRLVRTQGEAGAVER